MSDFITFILPMREDPLTRVFPVLRSVAGAVERIIKRSHREGDPRKRFDRSIATEIHHDTLERITIDFSMYPEQGWSEGDQRDQMDRRSLSVFFNYRDGADVPNLAFCIGRWGRFDMIFDMLTEAFLEEIDPSKPIVRERGPDAK